MNYTEEVLEPTLRAVKPINRPILQRRNSLANTFQAPYDGLVVILLILALTIIYNGVFSMQYILMTLVLLITMALSYDRFNVYRYHGTMTRMALTLLKAWSLSFGLLLILAFLTKNTETYSRNIVILLYLIGYVAQVGGHIAFRSKQYYSLTRQDVMKALIIGTGPLADHIFEQINKNPWIREVVSGTVTVNGGIPDAERENGSAPIMGDLNDIYHLIEEHHIDTVYIAVPLNVSPIIENLNYSLLDTKVNIHWAQIS